MYTPVSDSLFIAGNFNQWKPADENHRFSRRPDGTFELVFETDLDFLEFKITRGNWEAVEAFSDGKHRPNRLVHLAKASGDSIQLSVHAWFDLRHLEPCHTAASNVIILHDEFPIPQLSRTRRIWTYLPPDYWTSDRFYPVLYMLDGQNLFDDCHSHSGEWGVDEALNRMFSHSIHHPDNDEHQLDFPSAIVIGIENGGAKRTHEYSPWINAEYGGGEGEKFLDFITDTLKPYVDEHLRTLPERMATGIIGSSMGGLFALYAALKRNDIFGLAGIFSPSLWFSNEVWDFIKKSNSDLPIRILLMAGQQESKQMASDLLEVYELLLKNNHLPENLHYDLYPHGTHSESFWAQELEHAISWLFGLDPDHEHGIASNQSFHFTLIPENQELLITIDEKVPKPELHIMGYVEEKPMYFPLKKGINRISFEKWEEDYYLIRIYAGGDLVFSRGLLVNYNN